MAILACHERKELDEAEVSVTGITQELKTVPALASHVLQEQLPLANHDHS